MTLPGWTIEERLLFDMTRGALIRSEEVSKRASGADISQIDWNALFEHSLEGGVAPLLYRGLLDNRLDAPDEFTERLRAVYLMTAAENMRYLEYARTLLERCAEDHLDVIGLRGVAFVDRLYPDTACRPLSDIDILVRESRLPDLERILISLGYRRIAGHALQWTNASVVVDVHTDLLGGDRIAARRCAASIDMDMVWAAAIKTTIAGAPAHILCRVDTLISCGLHAIKHSCDRILWFADMAALLHSDSPAPWDLLIARARQFRLEKSTFYALRYLTRTIGFSIPDTVFDALRPSRCGWLEQRCMNQVLTGAPVGRFGELFMLFMMERRSDQWRFVMETLFPGKETLDQSFGKPGAAFWSKRFRRVGRMTSMGVDVLSKTFGRTG